MQGLAIMSMFLSLMYSKHKITEIVLKVSKIYNKVQLNSFFKEFFSWANKILLVVFLK